MQTASRRLGQRGQLARCAVYADAQPTEFACVRHHSQFSSFMHMKQERILVVTSGVRQPAATPIRPTDVLVSRAQAVVIMQPRGFTVSYHVKMADIQCLSLSRCVSGAAAAAAHRCASIDTGRVAGSGQTCCSSTTWRRRVRACGRAGLPRLPRRSCDASCRRADCLVVTLKRAEVVYHVMARFFQLMGKVLPLKFGERSASPRSAPSHTSTGLTHARLSMFARGDGMAHQGLEVGDDNSLECVRCAPHAVRAGTPNGSDASGHWVTSQVLRRSAAGAATGCARHGHTRAALICLRETSCAKTMLSRCVRLLDSAPASLPSAPPVLTTCAHTPAAISAPLFLRPDFIR